MKLIAALALTLFAALPSFAAPISVLFVGNSYTFGRVNPVMSYNAANVFDLTAPSNGGNFANTSGTNAFEPHPWGGVAGIFKQFTVEANLNYEVSLSTRNAASLRGQFLNSNAANWDLRGNIASKAWDKVVLQEQSDEPLTKRPGLASNPDYFQNYADKIEDFIHNGAGQTYRESDFFVGGTLAIRNAACVAATGASNATCTLQRTIPANAKANAAAEIYLYQTWARPNLVTGAFTSTTDPVTGAVTRTNTPATTFFNNLEAMTEELRLAFIAAAAQAAADGTGGFKGIIPVGQAFMSAVQGGAATRDFYAPNALTDGLIDLWFDDGTHASKYGSYLSALTIFGSLTGLDPQSLGFNEIAARDLGISGTDAYTLQQIAAVQLGFQKVPEPSSILLLALALAMLYFTGKLQTKRV